MGHQAVTPKVKNKFFLWIEQVREQEWGKTKMDVWDFVQLPVTCRSFTINNHFCRLQHATTQNFPKNFFFFIDNSLLLRIICFVPFIDSKLLPVPLKCHKYCYQKWASLVVNVNYYLGVHFGFIHTHTHTFTHRSNGIVTYLGQFT